VNHNPDQPGSEETAAGAGQDGEYGEALNLPLDALLDWGTDPAKADEDLEADLGALSAEAIAAAERDEYLDSLRRLQADFDNFRKRSLRQQTELLEHATEGLCVRLLPVLDALDLAKEHLRGQAGATDAGRALEQIDSLLRDVLAREGVEKIDAVGVPFDPTIHDAVGHVPAEQAAPQAATPPGPAAPEGGDEVGPDETDGPGRTAPSRAKPAKAAKAPAQAAGPTVAQVMRAGYKMNSKVLRPAMVLVGG
jgi:molecular chaperone GrpE